MMTPRIDIQRAEIARVVATFYARIRSDDLLGPIFSQHVENWPEHEEKIACFWANAILFERSYDGNPMAAHLRAGNVIPDHFEHWLALFDTVLQEQIAPPQAAQWSALAHRIGRGLSSGLVDARRPKEAVPRF